MKRLLTIDLGVTTGWCRFFEGTLQQYGIAESTDFDAWEKLVSFKVDTVVVERPAYNEGDPNKQWYEDCLLSLRTSYRLLKVVRATDWKQRYGSYPLPGRGVLKTQHEKDAFRIGAWVLGL